MALLQRLILCGHLWGGKQVTRDGNRTLIPNQASLQMLHEQLFANRITGSELRPGPGSPGVRSPRAAHSCPRHSPRSCLRRTMQKPVCGSAPALPPRRAHGDPSRTHGCRTEAGQQSHRQAGARSRERARTGDVVHKPPPGIWGQPRCQALHWASLPLDVKGWRYFLISTDFFLIRTPVFQRK